MAVCPNEVADLLISAVWIVQTARRTNPALVVPTVKWRILRAREIRFELLQPGPRIPDKLPRALQTGCPQRFLEIECGVGLPLRDSQPEPGIHGEKPPLRRRQSIFRPLFHRQRLI